MESKNMSFDGNTILATVLAVGLATLICGIGSAQANIITNGDFTTDANGWTFSAAIGCCGGGHNSFGSGGINTGSVLLNSNGLASSDPSVSQTVSGLTIGNTYSLSWALYLFDPVDPANTTVNSTFGVFLDGAVIHLSEQLTQAWVPDSLIFAATATSHTLTFAAELDTRTPGVDGTSDTSYYIDDISMVLSGAASIPEPATLAILSLGLLGMGLGRSKA